MQRETRNLEFLKDSKGAPEVVTTPLKPGQTIPFRVAFDGLPTSWNHQVPQMRIVHVTAPGQPGIPAGDTSGTGATGAAAGGTQGAAAGQGGANGSATTSSAPPAKPAANPPQ